MKSCNFVLIAWAALLLPPPVAAQVLYAVDGGGGASSSSLYVIDPATGAVATTIGTVTLTSNPTPLSVIAFQPGTGTLYGITNLGVTSQLVTVDLANAQATAIGNVGLSMQGLAFSPTGNLFGYSKAGVTGNASLPRESLYAINLASGNASLVGPSGFTNTQGDGMAIDSIGRIFFSGSQSNGQLSLLNAATGAASPLANLTGGPTPATPIKGLAFDNGGELFGLYNGALTDLLRIGTIPVGGSVAITDIGSITPPTPSVLTSLAFQSSSVPEPGSLALLGVVAASLGLLKKGRKSSSRPALTPLQCNAWPISSSAR